MTVYRGKNLCHTESLCLRNNFFVTFSHKYSFLCCVTVLKKLIPPFLTLFGQKIPQKCPNAKKYQNVSKNYKKCQKQLFHFLNTVIQCDKELISQTQRVSMTKIFLSFFLCFIFKNRFQHKRKFGLEYLKLTRSKENLKYKISMSKVCRFLTNRMSRGCSTRSLLLRRRPFPMQLHQ